MTFKQICFAADFAPESRPAFDVAVEMARRFDAELVVLHVYTAPGFTFPDGSFMPSPAKELLAATDAIDRELEAWRALAASAGVPARKLSIMGHPATEIARHGKDTPGALIVMGTHGRGFFRHALLGSVAERVVRTATCPVVTVRTG